MEVKQAKIQDDITDIINKMWEEYELTPNNVEQYEKPENVSFTQRRVNVLRTEIRLCVPQGLFFFRMRHIPNSHQISFHRLLNNNLFLP